MLPALRFRPRRAGCSCCYECSCRPGADRRSVGFATAARARAHFHRRRGGLVDGLPDGMVVASFTGVSLEPPLASICIQDSSRTWRRLRRSGLLGVSVLAEDQPAHVGRLSSKTGERFADVRHHAVGDAVLIDGATAHFTAVIAGQVTHGDHLVVMLELRGATAAEGRPPLVFHGSELKSLAA
ncbi:flavin reductase family protein [Corynebacterium hansenii]|uniref:Flavin reductase family protein n=1 Tax=Corynebacterium hansenii TaxID=394964 RepID=A0ABV7ZMN3_9CORY